jgi:hypothetical protein
MRLLSILFVLLLFAFVVKGQPEEESQYSSVFQNQATIMPDRLYYGGFVTLTLGSYTVIGATPLIGYKVSPQFSIGTQLSYEYFSDKRGSNDFSSSNYGASIFTRYRFIPELYGHLEYSYMNYEFNASLIGDKRQWVPFLFVGGGFSQPISNTTWLNAQVLFDVIQDENSPFEDWEPFYSVGIGIGF